MSLPRWRTGSKRFRETGLSWFIAFADFRSAVGLRPSCDRGATTPGLSSAGLPLGMQSAARRSRSIPPPTKERHNTNRFLGSRLVSPSDWTINRDDFVAVDHGINSVCPVLHQLGAPNGDFGRRWHGVLS